MTDVVYNDQLLVRLHTIRKATEQLSKEDSKKTAEQLIAEIDIIKSLLDETRSHLVKKSNLIL